MSDETTTPMDLGSILASYASSGNDPAALRAKLDEVFASSQAAAPKEASAALESLACCLESVGPDSPTSFADAAPVITTFLADWETFSDAAPTAVDPELPKKVMARAPEAVRREKRFFTILRNVEKARGRTPSRMTIAAVVSCVEPDFVSQIVKAERNLDILTALLSSRGDVIDSRTATQVFKRLNDIGMAPEVAQAFTKLKYGALAALLPLDSRGTLGHALPRSVLAAIIKPAPAKDVAVILRNSGSRRAIECCLDERVLAAESEEDDVAKWLRAFFEGLPKFASSDSEAMCSRLVGSSLASGAIVDALRGSAGRASGGEHGKTALVNAALRTLAVPELRKRSLSLLVRADELAWLNGDAARRYEEALAIPQATALETDDDSTLRWRICDRVIACLERAKDQNYDRVALEAILMGTLGEFGLRTGANAGEPSSFDGDIHEITMWGCRQGEPVLLQTDLLRLDDPVAGDVVRKARVIPVAKVNETGVAIPAQ